MNRYLIICTAVLGMLWSIPVAIADYQKALDAYNAKDYVTALEEATTLAEQGDYVSQLF